MRAARCRFSGIDCRPARISSAANGAWFQMCTSATRLKATVPSPSQWIGFSISPRSNRMALKVPYSPLNIHAQSTPTATGAIAQGTRTTLRRKLRAGKTMLRISAMPMPSSSPPATVTKAKYAVRPSAAMNSGSGKMSM